MTQYFFYLASAPASKSILTIVIFCEETAEPRRVTPLKIASGLAKPVDKSLNNSFLSPRYTLKKKDQLNIIQF